MRHRRRIGLVEALRRYLRFMARPDALREQPLSLWGAYLAWRHGFIDSRGDGATDGDDPTGSSR